LALKHSYVINFWVIVRICVHMSAQVIVAMVVSPGESSIALDSLMRADALCPFDVEFFLADNTGDPAALAHFSARLARPLSILPVLGAPRPYFEIARTVFRLLSRIAPGAPELVIKIDPDTVVLSRLFFSDFMSLAREADFIAAHTVYRSFDDNCRRLFRLLLDLLPLGLARSGTSNRYGGTFRLRFSPAWHWRSTLGALVRLRARYAQPSGGAYGLSGRMLTRLAAVGWLVAGGKNGLEWNDDTLLPLAIAALGGTIADLRRTSAAEGWRWMHGSRYFDIEDLREPGLRAVHPLKNTPADLDIRQSLTLPTK
jgi:hypothetical protein